MRDDPQQTVQRFNDCINARDLVSLERLMTENHAFVDSTNAMLRGKAAALAAWREFFQLFPDYQNVFERMTTDGTTVKIVGRSKCSDSRLEGPALWTATVEDGKVAEWRVHEDLPENRRRLGF